MGDAITSISPNDLIARVGTRGCPLIFDVRRAQVYAAATDMIQGAAWRDPATVDTWGRDLPADAEIVVYCVHGHEVSQGAATALRRIGRRAACLEGGIEGWRRAGGALTPRRD